MKILFIENRGKTRLWEQVALLLRQEGHETAWMVQNPLFTPRSFAGSECVHVLPFPKRQKSRSLPDEDGFVRQHFPALITDRGRRHFGAGAAHYGHYTAEIEHCLRRLQPDLVVGESSLFHELIAIDLCRRAGIKYLHPCANRYPAGRFSLFSYDTQLPVSQSGETWTLHEARALAERIETGREIPFYMQALGPFEKSLRRFRWALTRGRVWWSRLRGERYNTPALWRKLTLQLHLVTNLRRWRQLQGLPAVPNRTLLYPLQLQPEANIDVWGRPYSDQVAVLRELLAAAPADVQIAVKANPKGKYEVSEELLHLAEMEPRLRLLPLEMNMAQAQAQSVGAITVSGTVGLEAIFGKGRCLSLRHPLIECEFPEFHADSLAHAVHRLLHEPHAGVGEVAQGTRLIHRLVEQSFPGLVSEPLLHPSCLDSANIQAVAGALSLSLRVTVTPKDQLASGAPACEMPRAAA